MHSLFFDPAPHLLHVDDKSVPPSGSPHQRSDCSEIADTELAVTRDGSSLQQRLKLPRFRPSLVVRDMARQRSRQSTRLAFWPQSRIDLPQRTFRRDCRASRAVAEAKRSPIRVAARSSIPSGRLDDVDHINIADVVELVAPALSHADDRELDRVGIVPDLGPRDCQRRLQRTGRQVC